MVFIRITRNLLFNRPFAFRWAVAFPLFFICAIDFDQHRIVDLRTKSTFDSLYIGSVTVSSQLNATVKTCG